VQLTCICTIRRLTVLLENVAKDLESFSSHAGRTTVTTDDVMLLARRNADLHQIIKDFIDEQKASKASEKRN
jgi:centromere protein S